MTYKFKTGDKGKTRDGREYRVVADDRTARDAEATIFPLVVLVRAKCGDEIPDMYCRDGRAMGEKDAPSDLMPPVVTREVWLSLDKYENIHLHTQDPSTSPVAGRGHMVSYSGPHTIEFTPGEGLEQ